MATSGFQWVKHPDALARNIEKYGERVFASILALGEYFAAEAQDEMRIGAPWEDRTGNARSGLFSIAEHTADGVVTIYLSHGHTIEYGIHLELDHGGMYAIIVPTIDLLAPEIEDALDRLLKD
jgi:hypothetical protein